jgi:hypothetical protein
MPLLAALLYKVLGWIYAGSLAIFGAQWATRITAATTIAGLYIACALTFSVMIIPWLAGWLATGFGMLLGLLFPPVAGTVIAALGTFWACILAKRHSVRLIKMVAGGG